MIFYGNNLAQTHIHPEYLKLSPVWRWLPRLFRTNNFLVHGVVAKASQCKNIPVGITDPDARDQQYSQILNHTEYYICCSTFYKVSDRKTRDVIILYTFFNNVVWQYINFTDYFHRQHIRGWKTSNISLLFQKSKKKK